MTNVLHPTRCIVLPPGQTELSNVAGAQQAALIFPGAFIELATAGVSSPVHMDIFVRKNDRGLKCLDIDSR